MYCIVYLDNKLLPEPILIPSFSVLYIELNFTLFRTYNYNKIFMQNHLRNSAYLSLLVQNTTHPHYLHIMIWSFIKRSVRCLQWVTFKSDQGSPLPAWQVVSRCLLPSGAKILNTDEWVPQFTKSTDYYPLLLFHVGTNNDGRQNMRRIKDDYKSPGSATEKHWSQVFSSILPVGGRREARNRCIIHISPTYVAGAIAKVWGFMIMRPSTKIINC